MSDPKRALLADARTIARDQVERIFEERLTALSAGVVEALTESLAHARRELAGKLNQSVRRLHGTENEEQWSKALVDATQGFCDRAALFALDGKNLHLQASRNIAGQVEDVAIEGAQAFASAVQSKETVIALRTKSEMSDAIAGWIGADASRKFCLFPIIAKERVVCLLYADATANIETNGLELLATVAAAVIESRNFATAQRATLVTIAPPSRSRENLELHLKAQRFARNQVAEIRLYKSQNVKIGRASRNLYATLKQEIDSARENFRRDCLSGPGTMVDYLHLELVRTLANDDVQLLGPDYPGPLV